MLDKAQMENNTIMQLQILTAPLTQTATLLYTFTTTMGKQIVKKKTQVQRIASSCM
jgi:hypothetical protein